jgi:hypothetical protein
VLQEAIEKEPSIAAARMRNMSRELYNLYGELRSLKTKRRNNEEWWKTYRAALGGLNPYGTVSIQQLDELATKLANLKHGALQPLPEDY